MLVTAEECAKSVCECTIEETLVADDACCDGGVEDGEGVVVGVGRE
jgi:hypothetical protein